MPAHSDDVDAGWPAGRAGADDHRGAGGFGACHRAQHGPGCCGRRGGRAKRGWIRAALLALLAERSMHGYEMITELGRRTEGAWSPSPGAVYPALQLLAEDGLIDSETDGGRRRYTLTGAGRRMVTDGLGPLPWEAMTRPADPAGDSLREAIAKADAAAAQVLETGTADQRRRAGEILSETRRALYLLLAEAD